MDMNYSYLHMSKPIPGAPGHKFYAGATYTPGTIHFERECAVCL